MTSVSVTLTLPDELVREAEAAGLLSAEALEEMIQQAVRRRRPKHGGESVATDGASQMSAVDVESEGQPENPSEGAKAVAPEQVSRVLRAAGLLTDLSRSLQQRADASVKLDDVQAALARAGGQPLSEMVLEHRGQKE